MSAGKRKPVDEVDNDIGLFDLGDVSADLAVLGRSPDRLADLDGGAESATDYEYDSVSSPGGSTCSGPTYKRHAGFGPESGGGSNGGRPLSQLSEDGAPSPVGRGAGSPCPLAPSSSSPCQPTLLGKGLLSRHRVPGPLDKLVSLDNKTKKKKGLLRPELSEIGQDIRGVKIQAKPPSSLGTPTSTKNRHRKGKKKINQPP